VLLELLHLDVYLYFLMCWIF